MFPVVVVVAVVPVVLACPCLVSRHLVCSWKELALVVVVVVAAAVAAAAVVATAVDSSSWPVPPHTVDMD